MGRHMELPAAGLLFSSTGISETSAVR